ncbi:DUF1302 domain-containing protein [Solimonas sp. K1W22B-7]|uniref:DUF1302 domain-containing protein n=1 Tax=Solimonas sp. K1W22B-7 TaxID=2303331 RepID=UPI0013C41A7F|nr:DUF1302 family protein [Solimonas sp. K1W22B-7]
MPLPLPLPRFLPAALLAVALAPVPAQAFELEFGESALRIDNILSVGAVMRMQDRDSSLVGKSNLQPGLCVARTTPAAGYDPGGDNTFSGDTCSSTVEDPTYGNRDSFFITQPGALTSNGDDGNLSFEKHDLVQATAKLTSDIGTQLYGFNLFVRTLAFFDQGYSDYRLRHPDTTLQDARSDFSGAGVRRIGHDFQVLDYFVSRAFERGDHPASIKLGRQVLNWGESSLLALNSLNTINPPNQALLRLPGADIKEVFQPVGMAVINAEVFEGLNLEAFYQYEWQPIQIDPVGSFFSSSDTLGEGGDIAMLAFGKSPEDPRGLYEPWRNPDDPAAILGSTSSRTLYRDHAEERRRRPDDGGQYGVAMKMFFDGLNNGTEIGLYYANYHSRAPALSAFAADATCIRDGASGIGGFLQAVGDCEIPLGNVSAGLLGVGDFGPAGREALPLDSVRLVVEYPEDVHVYGISFNTTVGDLAWSGEYAFRDNLPLQIQSTDLIFAALQPAFPAEDFIITSGLRLPGRRTAAPDFLTQYRGIAVNPGDYIRGYERMKVGQVSTTLAKTIGGSNWIKASQILVALEMGLTHVLDMPRLSELQFQGGGTDTHISNGGDGSIGYNPRDVRCAAGDAACDPDNPRNNANVAELAQNPTAQARGNYGTEISYGYRLLTLTRYDDLFANVNVELLNALFHDVEGVAPGVAQNFVEGRMQIVSGLRMDYLSRWNGELRYTWYTGGGNRDSLRDRDNLMLSLGLQF